MTTVKHWDKLPIGTVLLAPSGSQRRIVCELFTPTPEEAGQTGINEPYYVTERVDGRDRAFGFFPLYVRLSYLTDQDAKHIWHLHPSSFADHARRVDLSAAGFFSIDDPAFVAKRAAQAADLKRRVDAYAVLGLDRDAVLKRVAAVIEAKSTNGIWATSTGEYADRRAALDNAILYATGATSSVRPWEDE